jgi:class 3 adenylate cyclase
VTVLFCYVTGSTAPGESTDPEALRVLLARCFARMEAIVGRTAGRPQKRDATTFGSEATSCSSSGCFEHAFATA